MTDSLKLVVISRDEGSTQPPCRRRAGWLAEKIRGACAAELHDVCGKIWAAAGATTPLSTPGNVRTSHHDSDKVFLRVDDQ